jgi:hypothetical protein
MKWGQNHRQTIAQLQGSQSPFREIISTPTSEKHRLSPVSSSFCALNLPQDGGGQSQTTEMEGYMAQAHPLQQPSLAQPNYLLGEADLAQERSGSPVRDIAIDSMRKHAVSFSHHRIRPLVPEAVARYDRNIFM